MQAVDTGDLRTSNLCKDVSCRIARHHRAIGQLSARLLWSFAGQEEEKCRCCRASVALKRETQTCSQNCTAKLRKRDCGLQLETSRCAGQDRRSSGVGIMEALLYEHRLLPHASAGCSAAWSRERCCSPTPPTLCLSDSSGLSYEACLLKLTRCRSASRTCSHHNAQRRHLPMRPPAHLHVGIFAHDV